MPRSFHFHLYLLQILAFDLKLFALKYWILHDGLIIDLLVFLLWFDILIHMFYQMLLFFNAYSLTEFGKTMSISYVNRVIDLKLIGK